MRLRRCPLTLLYSSVLLITGIGSFIYAKKTHRAEKYVSTDLHNLEHHPIPSLFGSALFNDGNSITMFIVLVVALCTMELWIRWFRTLCIFLTGHIGATLLTYLVIEFGLAHDWYEPSIRHTSDFGISYGVFATLGALVARPPKAKQRWAMLVVVVFYLALQDPFEIPSDFTDVGHTIALSLGLLIAGVILLRRKLLERKSPSHS